MAATEREELARLARGALIVGFEGATLSADALRRFREAQFAGYLLFARNVENFAQVRALTDSLREVHEDGSPIIAIDQEGGRVARLRDGAHVIPPMMALGAIGDRQLAQRVGASIAFDLRRVGCNVDYAPVLDLAVDPMNLAIGTRAFAADPKAVVSLASAVASGLLHGGIVPTYKHFPGHGSTADDSHLMLPVIEMPEAAFRERDLVPFARLLRGAPAVMTAHIVVRAIDPTHPATLSKRILTGLLREELGFDGVCFTDCMQMDAIARGVGTIPGIVAAIGAGADCALVSDDPELALRAADALADAVLEGTLQRSRLEEACRRIRTLRTMLNPPIALDALDPDPQVGVEVASRALTSVRGYRRVDPRDSIAVSFQNQTTDGAAGTLNDYPSLTARFPALEEVLVPLDPSDAERAQVLERVAASGRQPIVLARRAHFYQRQEQTIATLLASYPQATLVSLREPFDLALFPQAQYSLAIYGDDSACIVALGAALFAGDPPQGVLPVHLKTP